MAINRLLLVLGILGAACSDPAQEDTVVEPTLSGRWKFVSFVVSECDEAADNREDRCTATAVECGIFTISDDGWTWEQGLPDGSVFSETGTYTLSSNYIILTGDTVPGLGKYSITGSTVSYTTTSLTFLNSSVSSGCAYTVTFSRHLKAGVTVG